MAGESGSEFEQSEFLRREIHNSIRRYPTMQVYQTIGVLEAVKMDVWDQLERFHQEEESGE
jgi:hypothetical protein